MKTLVEAPNSPLTFICSSIPVAPEFPFLQADTLPILKSSSPREKGSIPVRMDSRMPYVRGMVPAHLQIYYLWGHGPQNISTKEYIPAGHVRNFDVNFGVTLR